MGGGWAVGRSPSALCPTLSGPPTSCRSSSSLTPVPPTPLSPLKVPQTHPPTLKPPPPGSLPHCIQRKTHTEGFPLFLNADILVTSAASLKPCSLSAPWGDSLCLQSCCREGTSHGTPAWRPRGTDAGRAPSCLPVTASHNTVPLPPAELHEVGAESLHPPGAQPRAERRDNASQPLTEWRNSSPTALQPHPRRTQIKENVSNISSSQQKPCAFVEGSGHAPLSNASGKEARHLCSHDVSEGIQVGP